jgi:hypothetical protein
VPIGEQEKGHDLAPSQREQTRTLKVANRGVAALARAEETGHDQDAVARVQVLLRCDEKCSNAVSHSRYRSTIAATPWASAR